MGLIFLWTIAATLFVAQPALADTTSDAEACFLAKINAARVATGAQKLSSDSTLAGYARIHSKAMAENGSIYHSSTNDLAPYLPGDWMKWGENVGVGGSCDALFDAFWASPSHHDNLLDPVFQYAGIGVYIDGSSVIWTTHVFLQRASAPATTTTTTAPPPVTTTTSPPPTTTTHPPTTTTTTHPPATTSTTHPPATTTTQPPATTTTTPTPASTSTTTSTVATSPPTTTLASTTTGATSTTASEGVPETTTTTTRPDSASSLASLVGDWENDGVLCSEGRCGGDQALLAFIGVVLLGGSALTTWSLRG